MKKLKLNIEVKNQDILSKIYVFEDNTNIKKDDDRKI